MRKLKDIVKEDFTNKLDTNLSFDTSSLKVSEKKVDKKKIIKRVSIAVACCVIISIIAVPTGLFLDMLIEEKSSFRVVQKNYSIHQLKEMESSSFKKLNDITYPSSKIKENEVNEEYVNSVNNFAYEIYKNTSKEENFAFSPLNLHANLSIASEAIENEEILQNVDSILGLNKTARSENYKKVYENNYILTDSGTTQMYNGVFATNKYQINANFINSLSSYYAEAYSLDFANDSDIEKMLNWVGSTVNEPNFLSKKDLNLNDESAMYIFSTLYFNNKWLRTYDTVNTRKDEFYLTKDNSVTVDFMYHEYMGDIYEYDKYVSCYDNYANGYKIQYIVPKSLDDNIYEVIADKNFLIEDETKKVTFTTEYGNGDVVELNPIIKLSLPKFDSTSKLDFNNTLNNMGLSVLFDRYSKSFNGAFENLEEDVSVYLDFVKQKNTISFTETGTTIKSIAFTGFMAGAAGPAEERDEYQVDLNQAFIYVIYDKSNIPLYVGCVDNPIV